MNRLFLVSCALIALTMISCAPPTNGRPPLEINGTTTSRPDWALNGRHADYPKSDWFFASNFVEGVQAPSKSLMYDALAPLIHQEAVKALGDQLPQALQEAAQKGMWISRRLIPDDKTLHYTWSGGTSAAAYITLNKLDLRDYLSTRSMPALPALLGDAERELPAHEVFAFRTRRFAIALERVMLAELSQNSFLEHEKYSKESLIQECMEALAFLKDFRRELLIEMKGGDEKRLQLGATPQTPITLRLTYQGEPAAFLPLTPYIETLNATGQVVKADRQTKSNGVATIQFVSPLRYTGKESLYLGFGLAPDKRLPELKSGVEIFPWRTRLTTPMRTNVVLHLSLREKLGGKSVTGPIYKGLESLIRGQVPVANDPSVAERSGSYVLEIGGQIAIARIGGRSGSGNQVRAEGAVILRHHHGPTISSIKVQGFADVRGDQIERAEIEALENLWAVHEQRIRAMLKEAFPPLVP